MKALITPKYSFNPEEFINQGTEISKSNNFLGQNQKQIIKIAWSNI